MTHPTWDVYDIEMRMLGDLLLELKSIPEGAGTMLDSTLVVTYSDMGGGGHHFTIPGFTLLAGGRNARLGGKGLKLGKYVKLPAQRANNDLLLTLAHLMGVTSATDDTGKTTALDAFGNPQHNGGLLGDILG